MKVIALSRRRPELDDVRRLRTLLGILEAAAADRPADPPAVVTVAPTRAAVAIDYAAIVGWIRDREARRAARLERPLRVLAGGRQLDLGLDP